MLLTSLVWSLDCVSVCVVDCMVMNSGAYLFKVCGSRANMGVGTD